MRSPASSLIMRRTRRSSDWEPCRMGGGGRALGGSSRRVFSGNARRGLRETPPHAGSFSAETGRDGAPQFRRRVHGAGSPRSRAPETERRSRPDRFLTRTWGTTPDGCARRPAGFGGSSPRPKRAARRFPRRGRGGAQALRRARRPGAQFGAAPSSSAGTRQASAEAERIARAPWSTVPVVSHSDSRSWG